MPVRICISNSTITQDARVLNNATIRDDQEINIDILNTKVNGRAVVWENLSIEPVLTELKQKSELMDRDSREFGEVQKILQVKSWNKKDFIKCIAQHVTEFSRGVLASIVANYIS